MDLFLHTFTPNPILISIGPITIYYYGLFFVLAILAGLGVTLHLAKKYNIEKDLILDLAFVLIVSGLIGARMYDVFLELPYYIKNPINIFKIWQGGLAIHGGIIGGLIGFYFFFRKKVKNNNLPIWKILSIITPALALGQAIGRWGNYFNQELFGAPTNLPWGIPINITKRPEAYVNFEYFHPTFLYESIGNFCIFIILIYLHYKIINTFEKKNASFVISNSSLVTSHSFLISLYLFLYSVLRFTLEFIRIDYAPIFFGMRAPQVVSLMIAVNIFIFYITKYASNKENKSTSCHLDRNE